MKVSMLFKSLLLFIITKITYSISLCIEAINTWWVMDIGVGVVTMIFLQTLCNVYLSNVFWIISEINKLMYLYRWEYCLMVSDACTVYKIFPKHWNICSNFTNNVALKLTTPVSLRITGHNAQVYNRSTNAECCGWFQSSIISSYNLQL